MHGTALGKIQIAILRTVTPPGQGFVCKSTAQRQAALKLHQRGLLDRDLGLRMSGRFIGNAAGERFIQQHDGGL